MPLKIGILYISAYESGWTEPFPVWYEQMLRQIELADAVGLHGAWVAEHRIPGYSLASPPVFLTAAALRTRRIRLGTAVCLVPLHHPVQTAEDYATLDVLSGGRLDFGVGRGQFPYDFAVAEVNAEESRARLEENLAAILSLWSDEVTRHEGQFHRFTHRMLPKPIQRPHPPVYAAAARTAASYTWAGERGFHLQIAPLLFSDLGRLRGYLDSYRAALAAAGHDPAARDLLAAYPLYIGEREDDAIRIADPHLKRLARYNAFSLFAGLDCGRKGAFDEFLRDRYGDTAADNRAPEGSHARDWHAWKEGRVIFGTPDRVVDQIGRVVEDTGLTYLVFEIFYGGQPHSDVMAYLERLGARVLPQLDVAPPPPPIQAPQVDLPVGPG
ncbi:MAG TPA: LLM class flavin-dependent oxidoreductase [Dehalococcoidia bacterium]|nr:LLM class flavin-dependent oxidoreductase [Dehalococcoidia bacterium]